MEEFFFMRTKLFKFFTCLVGAILLLGLGTYMVLDSAFRVEETIISIVHDSKRKWEGIIVRRDAGATVSTSYSIRVRQAGLREQGTEVVLIDKVESPDRLKLFWNQDGLSVVLPTRYHVFKKLDSVKIANSKIRITYIKG